MLTFRHQNEVDIFILIHITSLHAKRITLSMRNLFLKENCLYFYYCFHHLQFWMGDILLKEFPCIYDPFMGHKPFIDSDECNGPFLPQLTDSKFYIQFQRIVDLLECMPYRPKVQNLCSKMFQNLTMVGSWFLTIVESESYDSSYLHLLDSICRWNYINLYPVKEFRLGTHHMRWKDSWEHQTPSAHELGW